MDQKRGASHSREEARPLRVKFSLEEIFGKRPKEVASLFRCRGLNPVRPYRVRLSSAGVIIEQD